MATVANAVSLDAMPRTRVSRWHALTSLCRQLEVLVQRTTQLDDRASAHRRWDHFADAALLDDEITQLQRQIDRETSAITVELLAVDLERKKKRDRK